MTSHQVVVLRRGDRGTAVADVCDRLVLTGDLPAEWAGSAAPRESVEFGEEVERAVKSFQQRRGLLVDGIVGRSTYSVLDGARWSLGGTSAATCSSITNRSGSSKGASVRPGGFRGCVRGYVVTTASP